MDKYKKLNYNYDKELILAEIFSHVDKFINLYPRRETFNQRPFSIVSDELYEKLTALEKDGTVTTGSFSAWQGFSFTHIPGDRLSEIGQNKDRLTKENWQWKPNVDCQYLKKIVKDLGFTSIQNIRVMVINAGGFGPVHSDIISSNNYYETHTSVTLNIEDGGQALVALINGQLHELNDPCFIFEDDCWHGVGVVSSRRTQVRINGIANKDILNSYLD